jgi:hypothetical protein
MCTHRNERAGYLLAGVLHFQYMETEPDEMFIKVGWDACRFTTSTSLSLFFSPSRSILQYSLTPGSWLVGGSLNFVWPHTLGYPIPHTLDRQILQGDTGIDPHIHYALEKQSSHYAFWKETPIAHILWGGARKRPLRKQSKNVVWRLRWRRVND